MQCAAHSAAGSVVPRLASTASQDNLEAYFGDAVAASTDAAWDAAVAASEDACVHCGACGFGEPARRVPPAVMETLMLAALDHADKPGASAGTETTIVYTMCALAEAVNPFPSALHGDALGAMHACLLCIEARGRPSGGAGLPQRGGGALDGVTCVDMHIVKYGEHDYGVAATVAPLIGDGAGSTGCPRARTLSGRFKTHAQVVQHALRSVSRRARFVYVAARA